MQWSRKCYRLLYILFWMGTFSSFAQKEANIWYFGYYAGLDFNRGLPVALSDGQMSTFEGCATISDSNGNLLLYTDGISVWNRNHQIMLNGNGLLGDPSSSQSGIIVPKPGDPNIYYIFTIDSFEGSGDGLNYSEVDMNLDGGMGDVTNIKNVSLLESTGEAVTAVSHRNGRDVWVISCDRDNDNFYAYLITASGVNTNPIISSTGPSFDEFPWSVKASPNGKKLTVCTISNAGLFDFDADTGIVSNPIVLNNREVSYGAEFSPSNQLLYISVYGEGKLYQYDLNATDIAGSEIEIFSSPGYLLGQLQLGPDGKIYLARLLQDHLGVINDPDSAGVACNFEEEAVSLTPRLSALGLPNFIQSFFSPSIAYDATCFGNTTQFSLTTVPDAVVWDFGDPASGASNTSTLLEPTHVFSSPGTYTVTATATLGMNVTTETEIVTIYEVPIANQPADMEVCDSDNDGFATFDLTAQNSIILGGQSSATYLVEYYASMQDFVDDTPIANPESYQNIVAYSAQTIIAKVSNQENRSCEVTTSFTIQVFESPTPQISDTIPDITDCDNNTFGTDTDGFILFNLTDRETDILNGQSLVTFEISYYTDAGFTQQIMDPTIFVNTTRRQQIFCLVQNKMNNSCQATVSFFLEVFELPVITDVVSLEQCDDDTDGFSAFNLTEVAGEIITNPANFIITYHESIAEANAGLGAITNETAYINETVSTDRIWARVQTNNGCHRVSEVYLVVSTTQIPDTLSLSYYECDTGTDTTDGIATFDFSNADTVIRNIFPSSQQLIIRYYQSEAEALAEINPISDISNYQNTNAPNEQAIFVRVDSDINNDCLGLGRHITLFADTIIANPVNMPPECDSDGDGFFAFDTSVVQNTIIGSQTNVSVTYTDENGVTLPSPLPNPFVTVSQTITARITRATPQDPNRPCFDETQIAFSVVSVPDINSITVQETCDDDFDGIANFDTSVVESTLLGAQTGMLVRYFDVNNNELPSPLPNPFNSTSQDIRVRVENPLYDLCFRETTISFVVREKPDFELEQDEIICMTDNPSQTLMIQNPTGSFTYTWRDATNNVISNNTDVTVTRGGIYSVYATSTFGCNSEVKTIVVNESSIAQITRNDIEVIDDSNNNSIRVIGTNIGLGDYEFQLLDQNSMVIVDYQSDPSFTNLEGGVYTLNIRDQNGCGETSIEVSLLSFPRFFTPNNDGINDTWQIKGVTSTFYSEGNIMIFNRYGKRVGTFTINDSGWNGIYGGRQLPPNDYWFSVRLVGTNGTIRTRKGHFSLLRK